MVCLSCAAAATSNLVLKVCQGGVLAGCNACVLLQPEADGGTWAGCLVQAEWRRPGW